MVIILLYSTFGKADGKVSKQSFDLRVAIVDVEFILTNSLAMQEIKKKLNLLIKQIEQEVIKKEMELKKVEEQLIKKQGLLNEKEYDQELEAFNKQVSQTQQEIQSKKVRLEQAHNKAVGEVQEAIMSIIDVLATKYNLNLVLPSTQILYFAPELNITNEVIEQLNKTIRSIEVQY